MKARDFRARARGALSGNWGKACLAGIIATLFIGGGGVTIEMEQGDMPHDLPTGPITWEMLAPMLAIFLGAFLIAFTIALVLGSVVSIGYAQFNIDLIEGRPLYIRTLFSRFKQIGTAVGANLLVALRVLGGFILFIIPGIIASFKYAMISHVLADDPTLTAREALQRSKEIMHGNKWRYFCLSLSFIGWNMLIVITLGIAAIWVVPYEYAAYAAFYNEIKQGI